MIKTKLISCLEKPFADESFDKYPEYNKMSALAGETVSFQLLYTYEIDEENRGFVVYKCALSGALAPYATIRQVKNVAVQKPLGIYSDDNYLRTTPGVYPDVLVPFENGGEFGASCNVLNSLWIDVALPEDCTSLEGRRDLTVTITRKSNNTVAGEDTFTLDVINHKIGEEKTLHTEWVSADSLAHHYCVPMWSEEHWEIVEKYLTSARKNGVNVLHTPTNSLIVITKTARGYRFNFKKFDRWLAMANRLGFKYIETNHLYSAGDGAYAESLYYFENGEKKNIRGMRATDPEVVKLIRAYLKALVNHMKKVDDDKRLMFHIADEPALKNIDKFRASRDSIIDIIGNYVILDAIFDIEYYREGLVNSPVPITDHIKPFLEENVPHLWTYYCTGPQRRYSNRFIAQSGACTRSIGMQLYKYNIEGFLHWALCYYGAGDTDGYVEPYVDQNGGNWVPAGDTFLLYPAYSKAPYESLRLMILRDAFQDIRAMQEAEKYYSHAEVVRAIEEEFGEVLEFGTCAKSSETMLKIRERINEMIRKVTK